VNSNLPAIAVVLVAPNAFTGSLSAGEVASALARGFAESGWDVVLRPLADGGPGTRSILAPHVPSGVAVVEMAEHAGLHLGFDPLRSDTSAVGTAVNAAMSGAREIWVGLGGSRTTDGGTGLARALVSPPSHELHR